VSDPIRRVASARKRVTDSERALREAITAAFNDRSAGHTVEDIARAAGLTKQRVYQIANEVNATDA
jgi:AcrR family transcriptional regulator